ncbi:MAG: type II secretion system GspH family protein [Pseudomonadaceae bacterium]|nr:type II secretion system GspH family protein [Pseudomonadaceae bacterium]
MRGFSLLEMIAVMAIMAIFAGVLAPSVFRTIDENLATAEESNLEAMAEALEEYVLDSKRVPSRLSSDWGPAIAERMSQSTARILNNDRGYTRGVYFDPTFLTSSVTAFPGFTQDLGLTSAPNSPRVLVVSNLAANAPAAPTSQAAFDAIWQQTGTPSVTEGKMVKVVRLNLAPLFHRVLLTNDNATTVGFQVESGTVGSVAGASGVPGSQTRYVIDGSKISMFADPYPSGALQRQALVREDLSYHYGLDGAVWSWQKP